MSTPVEPNTVQGENTPGPNPAWNDVLSALPEEYHSVVTPHFQEWDRAAQTKIEQVNSQFEAYKPFIENEIDPEELERGLRLMYEINTNPQDVWKAIGEAYNLTPAEAKAVAAEIADPAANVQAPAVMQDPRYDQLQQGIELVSQIVLQEQQAKVAAQEDAAVETELKQLAAKHGKFDTSYVLALMLNDYTGEEAVQAFHEMKNNLLQSSSQAPNILGSSSGGSGLPSQAIDPTKLSSGDTKSLVAQMLRTQLGGN